MNKHANELEIISLILEFLALIVAIVALFY
jgi:hypothetical protein